MKIRQCMTARVISVGAEEPVAVAARLMARQDLGMLPVCSRSGELLGVVTDRDIAVRCVARGHDAACTRVRAVMSTRPVRVSPETEVHAAAALLAREQVRRLPVVEQGRLCGVVSLGDLARGAEDPADVAACWEEILSGVRCAWAEL